MTEIRRLALLEAATICDGDGLFQAYQASPSANDYELQDAAYSRGRADAAAMIRKAAEELNGLALGELPVDGPKVIRERITVYDFTRRGERVG